MDLPDLENSESDAARLARYLFLFENVPDPLLIIEDDRFTECNLAALRMLGCSDKSEVLNRHPSEISPEYQPDGRLSVDKANEILERMQKEPYQCFEWTHVRQDGTLFPVEVSLILVPGKKGHTLLTSWRDISVRKRLEKELRHSQKMDAIGKLAGGVAHDFNNQLVPIIGYADMLIERLKTDDKVRDWAMEIQRAARLATVGVRKLLAMSRKEQGEMVVVELGETAGSLLDVLCKLIGEDIVFDLQLPESPLWVRIGAGDIEQILLNLATNSRDAMPQGGYITVAITGETGPDGELAHLRFSDDGAGMDKRALANVFEPFFTTKELGTGTGLGLSTVYGIVTSAGGTIEVNSTPGRGTVFDLYLPTVDRALVPNQETATPVKFTPTPSIYRGHVLIVEDDEQVSQFAKLVLEMRGFRVTLANDALQALDYLEAERPNLILSDVIMPEISGPQMIEQFQASNLHLPVVYMSGYTDDRLADLGLDASGVQLIRKPFSVATLVDTIEHTLATYKPD